MSFSKKQFLGSMVCASALATVAIFSNNGNHVKADTLPTQAQSNTNGATTSANATQNGAAQTQTATQNTQTQAATNNAQAVAPKNQTTSATQNTQTIPARSYGVDVSSFQSKNLTSDAQAGAKFAIVKVSEGTSYRNPNAAGQIASAKQNNMLPMAYHFATFGNNSNAAKAQANYAVSSAQSAGLPNGSYIVADWETGDGNNVIGGKESSSNAILSFMDTVHDSGYQPMLYSGAYLLRNNVNTSKITSRYPNSLWVASYATSGRTDSANFNYFPSMDGVAIWQFTDNWKGKYVDGNISLVPLSVSSKSNNSSSTNNSKPASSQPTKTTTNNNVNSGWTKQNGVFVTGNSINLRTGASTNSSVIALLPANSKINYDAYRTIGQYTWLRQPRANGQYGYLVGRSNGSAWGRFESATPAKASQPGKTAPTKVVPKTPTTNNNVNDGWTKQNGSFITGNSINLRTGASTNSSVIALLPANSKINYDAYRTIGQYTWLRQPRANGQYGYLVGRSNGSAWGRFESASPAKTSQPAKTAPTEVVPKTSTTNNNVNDGWTKQSGSFITGNSINLRTGASTSSSVIALLPANSKVNYDAYRTIGQYTWLRQPRANGQYGYLVGRSNGSAWGRFESATPVKTTPTKVTPKTTTTNNNVNNGWTKQNGSFVTSGPINLRTDATTMSKIIAVLPANSKVNYDAYRTIGQYTWLRQPRANGQYGYIVGRFNGQAWGKFGE